MNGVFTQLDDALERVTRLREQLLRDVDVTDRAARLVLLFESEARLWSQLFDLASQRLVWRAALAGEALARHNSRLWRQRADEDTSPRSPVDVEIEVLVAAIEAAIEERTAGAPTGWVPEGVSGR